jgi:hypothetical protein
LKICAIQKEKIDAAKNEPPRERRNRDRAQLHPLVTALHASGLAMRRDVYGSWCIVGRYGHVYTWGDGESFALYVASGSKPKWFKDRKRLSFCELTQNGEDEGCLRLKSLPTPQEAAAIRFVLGINKRRSYSPAVLGAARQRLRSLREHKQALATEAFARDFSAEDGAGEGALAESILTGK